MKHLFAVSLLICAAQAQAHYVWMERDADGAGRVYFGEWHNDEYETTGGRLDGIKPRVVGADGTELALQRQQDHIAVLAKSPGDLWLNNSGAVRKDKTTGVSVRTLQFARAGRDVTQSRLDLELLPVAPGSDTLVLHWRGKPLADTRVTVYGPPKWQKTLTTDERGRIAVPTPWAGRYVLYASHSEARGGTLDGSEFSETRYVTTLSFTDAGDTAASPR